MRWQFSRPLDRAGRLILAGLLATLGCARLEPLAPEPPTTGQADFSTYVNLGTSITAGFQSNGWVDEFQRGSVAAHVAAQTRANATGGESFTQPLLASPGLPPVLELVSLSPLVLAPRAGAPPAGPYVPRGDGYDNLAIPTAMVSAALARTSG